jgi:hypothetical protein
MILAGEGRQIVGGRDRRGNLFDITNIRHPGRNRAAMERPCGVAYPVTSDRPRCDKSLIVRDDGKCNGPDKRAHRASTGDLGFF